MTRLERIMNHISENQTRYQLAMIGAAGAVLGSVVTTLAGGGRTEDDGCIIDDLIVQADEKGYDVCLVSRTDNTGIKLVPCNE